MRCKFCPDLNTRLAQASNRVAELEKRITLEQEHRAQLDLMVPEVLKQRKENEISEATREKMRVRLEILEKELSEERHARSEEVNNLKLQLARRTPLEQDIASLPPHVKDPLESHIAGNYLLITLFAGIDAYVSVQPPFRHAGSWNLKDARPQYV